MCDGDSESLADMDDDCVACGGTVCWLPEYMGTELMIFRGQCELCEKTYLATGLRD